MEYNFKKDQCVTVEYSEIRGIGRVVGCATTPLPVIGRMYMVQMVKSNVPFPNDEYPFDVISVPECGLKAAE